MGIDGIEWNSLAEGDGFRTAGNAIVPSKLIVHAGQTIAHKSRLYGLGCVHLTFCQSFRYQSQPRLGSLRRMLNHEYRCWPVSVLHPGDNLLRIILCGMGLPCWKPDNTGGSLRPPGVRYSVVQYSTVQYHSSTIIFTLGNSYFCVPSTSHRPHSNRDTGISYPSGLTYTLVLQQLPPSFSFFVSFCFLFSGRLGWYSVSSDRM